LRPGGNVQLAMGRKRDSAFDRTDLSAFDRTTTADIHHRITGAARGHFG
jgi:hypothetical protein